MTRFGLAFVALLLTSFSGCSGDETDTGGVETTTETGGTAEATLGTSGGAAQKTVKIVADVVEGMAPLNVTFQLSATGVNSNSTWRLSFGDGSDVEGKTLPVPAKHTYNAGGTLEAAFTVTFSKGQTLTQSLEITVTVPPKDVPDVTHFEFGPGIGCDNSFVPGCITKIQGPGSQEIDGHWLALDSRYWGYAVETTSDAVLGDTDCQFLNDALADIGEGNNGSGPCTGTIPNSTAWLFIYSYAEPHQVITVDTL